MKKLFIIIVLTVFTNIAIANQNLIEATNDVCICLEEPNKKAGEVVELIKNAQVSGDMSQIMAAQGEMMAVIGISSRCFERLPEKYPEINESEELKNRVMEMAEEKCPNPASGLLNKR